MDKTNIIETRRIGLGSSDAKMVASVGRSGQLNETAKKRIAEMLGIKERDQVSTQAMEAGNDIEQLIFESIKSVVPNAISNPFYQSKELTERFGFGIFNHIDIEAETENRLIWDEVKATIENIAETEAKYICQLSWHYMLLIEKARTYSVGKYPMLRLIHFDTSEGFEFDSQKITTKFVEYSDCLPTINDILKGLEIIAAELPSFVWIEPIESDGSNLPVEAREILPKIAFLLSEAKLYEEKAESLKTQLKKAMEAAGIKSIDNDYFKATFIPSGLQNRFDSAAFKKNCPELYSKYTKNIEVNSQLRINLK